MGASCLSVSTVAGMTILCVIGSAWDTVSAVVTGPGISVDIHSSGNLSFNTTHTSAVGGVSNVAPTL